MSAYPVHGSSGSDDRGFTLVEVVVSLAAMAIGFALVWGMHFSSLRMDMSAMRRSIAVERASGTLERFRQSSNWTAAACPGFNSTLSGVGNFYNCAFTVTTPPLYPWQRAVVVTVSWNERRKTVTGGTKTEVTLPNDITLSALYIK